MWPCRLVDWLIRFLPIKAGQDYLIRHHVSGCAACRGILAAEEEVRAVMFQEQDLLSVKDFRPELERHWRTSPKIQPRSHPLVWQWVSAAAALVVIVLSSLWLYRGFGGEGEVIPDQKLRIDYVKIEGEPARAYVYQPQGSDMTLVWVEKNGEGE